MQVNMRKRERTREQAAELRQMQKLFLLKAMANPGQPVIIIPIMMIIIIIIIVTIIFLIMIIMDIISITMATSGKTA